MVISDKLAIQFYGFILGMLTPKIPASLTMKKENSSEGSSHGSSVLTIVTQP
jgi:hypothetical protein